MPRQLFFLFISVVVLVVPSTLLFFYAEAAPNPQPPLTGTPVQNLAPPTEPVPAIEPVRHGQALILEEIPHVRQRPDFCGEACVEMWCQALKIDVDQNDVFNHAKLDPRQGRGCYTPELLVALKALGFVPGRTGTWIDAKRPAPELDTAFKRIVTNLENGHPSIVCMRYNERLDTAEHFRLITGYDRATDEVIYHEPAEADGAYRRMTRERFFQLWPLKYKAEQWLLIQFDLAGERIGNRLKSRDADFAQEVLKTRRFLKEHAPGQTFHIEIRAPFLVVGDETAGGVRHRADRTVAWSSDLLQKQFFEKQPEEIITIWLFKGKASYEKNLWGFWETKPFTPYGYFSSEHKALVMNIATGGGTLVHEIVHPFVSADFPGCASWVDEGIASLFEQCAERGGKIKGLTNWRLGGLQQAIERKRVPTFERLCSTTRNQFYDRDPGTNYSQSRYLMHYLQDQGTLETFYKTYRKNHEKDPTGWKTLQAVLGHPDMEEFQQRWQKWVMALEFRR